MVVCHVKMMALPSKCGRWFGKNRDQIYTELLDATNAGPFDGGCALLARAMQLRYGGEIQVLARVSGQADHAVLKVGTKYLDGDGYADSPVALITRFNFAEQAEVVGIRPMRKGDLPEAPREEKAAWRIAALLPALDCFI